MASNNYYNSAPVFLRIYTIYTTVYIHSVCLSYCVLSFNAANPHEVVQFSILLILPLPTASQHGSDKENEWFLSSHKPRQAGRYKLDMSSTAVLMLLRVPILES